MEFDRIKLSENVEQGLALQIRTKKEIIMIEFANWLFKVFPPLTNPKNSQIAAVLGFLFGGIGLGIYFLSFIDFVIPILFAFLLSAILPSLEGAWLVGAIIAALWGYLRAEDSNSRLAQK